MRLFAWFLEDEPGTIGKLEIDAPQSDKEPPPKKWMIWLGIFLGILFNELALKWIFDMWHSVPISQSIVKLAGLCFYVGSSHRLTAKPDYSNMGWFSGLVDNPFRSSDNVNRWLVYLQVFLLPGKLMAYSLVMGWFLFQSVYKEPKK
ncbi:hypothetical protein [Spirosoma spitsbergense]|uniref:hypothetical protein n=1 Tax=Spirosoma spitsbergense TaxID=431554 RepID=UPI00037DC7A0|nr:hypothetical protein [Spirosoma spitsbergense]